MATEAENIQAALDSLAVKIVEVLANPLPNITVDGVSIDRMGYYRSLIEYQKLLREQLIAARGPHQTGYVAR